MKLFHIIFPILLLLVTRCTGVAQKQSFGLISYFPPTGWQQQQHEGGMQLSVTDKKTGSYAIAVIMKATASDASANENFNKDWNRLIKSTVQINGEPAVQPPAKENGWDIVSGNAAYTDGSNKGLATLLTATGGGQMVSVVLMTNTQIYQDELLAFLHSLELARVTANSGTNTPIANNANNYSIAGLWTRYTLETNGYYNGIPQYTAGYTRSEYLLKEDGSYIYRAKNWLVYGAKDILFVYETGTYAVNGNQITIIPNQGKGGWWKKTKSTKEWGPFVKGSTDYKSEKKTCNFEIKYFSGSGETELILKTGNNPGVQEYSYTKRTLNESLIDNPPGFKTGFENKYLTASPTKSAAITIQSPLTGKIWEGTTTEKFSNAGGTSFNTGGFATNQYQFNTDGTYRFVSVIASHFTDTKTLQYETGTYTINGNQLTITPVKGYNEEWSKIGKTSNGNSDVSNRAINDTWGEKLKTSARKLEQVTYTFSIGKNAEKTALILQYNNGYTEREGNGNQTYLNETPPENSVKLPAGMKW